MYSIKPFQEEHIPKAMELLKEQYLEEQSHHKLFFAFDLTQDTLESLLKALCNRKSYQYALYKEQSMVGFIMGYLIPNLWGSYTGFYSPLHGHAVKKSDRKKGYQYLYQHLSEELVNKSILTHAITLYYNDDIAMNTWFHLGFGLRLIDSYKTIGQIETIESKPHMQLRKLSHDSINELVPLMHQFQEHFEQAPLFMKQEKNNIDKELKEFLSKENHFIFGLYENNYLLALMKLRPQGENYLCGDPRSIHICGLYVDESKQSKGIATYFLQRVESEMQELGYKLLGVDFESFNIKGANFWHKFFQPYTFSLTRRIDEHILQTKKDE